MDHREPSQELRNSQLFVIGAVLLTTVFAVSYRAIRHEGFGHTGLMFVGLPAVLAILLAMLPRAKSATGAIAKGITFAMLIVAPLLGEGFICILMASPIFFLIGVIVGAFVDRSRRSKGVTLSCCALVLLPMSLEGVVPQLTFNRMQTVTVTRTVNAGLADVETALSESPRISYPLPAFLRLGFPRPLASFGEGLSPGATRTVHFTGAEGAPPGDLVVAVTAHRPGYLRTQTIADHTKLAQWLGWKSSEVTWTTIDATHTSVTWSIRFERELDPAWYFIPFERLAVHEAALYMIQSNATPQRR
jgi:hypothetical protein